MNWKILHKDQPASVEEIISVILENRGFRNKKEQANFLNPINPLNFTSEMVAVKTTELKKALKRINQAIDKKEQIVVYGDYDCDGICATAIMWQTLFSLKARVLPFIPDRMEEGYGLSKKGLDNLRKKMPDASLIITVDHGIVAVAQVEYARSLGLDVIISDHHTVGKKLPKALAIVHTTNLSGSGVSWFLSSQLTTNDQSLMTNDSLALAAFGTIADLVPLVGPNRSIAKFGIKEFNDSKKPGIQSLVKACGLVMGKIGTYEMSYILAPRINALGRIDNALDALRLLCTKDTKKSDELSNRLCEINSQRQKLTEETVLHARDLIKVTKKSETKLLFVVHEMYNQGVIGLVAGRLVEEFYRPAIVIAKGKEYSKASARSISGFNIIEAIRSKAELLVEAGGHPMAAGFTVATKNLSRLEEELNKLVGELINEEMLIKVLKIDCELALSLVTMSLWERFEELKPFGMGNSEPVFVSEAEILATKIVGNKGQHLQIKVKPADTNGPLYPTFPTIAFNQSYLAGKLKLGETIKIVYTVAKDEWNGGDKLQLKIKDIK